MGGAGLRLGSVCGGESYHAESGRQALSQISTRCEWIGIEFKLQFYPEHRLPENEDTFVAVPHDDRTGETKMLTTILLAMIICFGQLVAAIATASGVLLASGVITETTTFDRIYGAAMAALGIALFVMQFALA
jgi:hypothetical protein